MLAVGSTPIKGLTITGNEAGTTDYSVSCDDHEVINISLASPPIILTGGKFYSFVYWLVDGQPQPRGQTDLQIVMDTDHAAEALYNLFGDTNGDCTINILDLIFVRDHLEQDPTTGDNWRADINQDGDINVLDLINVRNEHGARCAEE